MRKGVYGGSFDPPTNGHLWIIRKGANLFDRFVIAVAVNPDKKYAFYLDERVEMLEEIIKPYKNTSVNVCGDKFLVNYAIKIGADYVLRGIRSHNDYEEERKMRNVNSDINSKIEPIFVMPPRELEEISSSLVKGLIGPEGWEEIIKKYVPKSVYKKILKKYDKHK